MGCTVRDSGIASYLPRPMILISSGLRFNDQSLKKFNRCFRTHSAEDTGCSIKAVHRQILALSATPDLCCTNGEILHPPPSIPIQPEPVSVPVVCLLRSSSRYPPVPALTLLVSY